MGMGDLSIGCCNCDPYGNIGVTCCPGRVGSVTTVEGTVSPDPTHPFGSAYSCYTSPGTMTYRSGRVFCNGLVGTPTAFRRYDFPAYWSRWRPNPCWAAGAMVYAGMYYFLRCSATTGRPELHLVYSNLAADPGSVAAEDATECNPADGGVIQAFTLLTTGPTADYPSTCRPLLLTNTDADSSRPAPDLWHWTVTG